MLTCTLINQICVTDLNYSQHFCSPNYTRSKTRHKNTGVNGKRLCSGTALKVLQTWGGTFFLILKRISFLLPVEQCVQNVYDKHDQATDHRLICHLSRDAEAKKAVKTVVTAVNTTLTGYHWRHDLICKKKKKEDGHLHILQIQNNNSVNLKWWAHVQCSLPFSFALVSILDIKTMIWATRCEVRDKVQLRPRSVLVSSGWPGCWRSGKPHLYRTRPPQWSTQSTAPGGTPHQHPSPSLLESHPQASLSAVPSSSSCSSGSSPAGFCNAAPPLSWLCSSSQTLLDTACGTSRAWTDTREMCHYILKWQNLYKLMNVSLTITSNLSLKKKNKQQKTDVEYEVTHMPCVVKTALTLILWSLI